MHAAMRHGAVRVACRADGHYAICYMLYAICYVAGRRAPATRCEESISWSAARARSGDCEFESRWRHQLERHARVLGERAQSHDRDARLPRAAGAHEDAMRRERRREVPGLERQQRRLVVRAALGEDAHRGARREGVVHGAEGLAVVDARQHLAWHSIA